METVKDYLIKQLLSARKRKELSSDIIAMLVNREFNEKWSTIHVRKAINLLRKENVPVLANSRGYYISYDDEDILESYQSLINRANEIIKAAEGLKKCVGIKKIINDGINI